MIRMHTCSEGKLAVVPSLFPMFVAIFIVVNFFSTGLVFGQETQKPAETKTPVRLSEQQWKVIEGIFQDPQNIDRYVQFTAGGDFLTAKLLWNNVEIKFVPESPTAFVSKEVVEDQLLHIVFKPDSSGAVNQVNLANIGVWMRAKDYKPVVKIEMQHSAGDLKPFEGLYRLDSDQERFIQFSEKDNKLVLKQHWDGNQISFVPETPLDFFSREVPLFSLHFTKDKDGNITQAMALKHDLWIKMRKAIITTEQLKPLEGKYQFKDDPDDFILLIVKNNNLVVKQLWDGKEITLEPLTDVYFYNDAQSYPLLVTKNSEGIVTQLVVLGEDRFNKVKE